MPNLLQMVAMCGSRSGYSRPNDILPALNEAGVFVYNAVLKEFSGFFLKFDTSSIVLTPGTQEYALPADCTQVVHLAERQSTNNRFAPMSPETIGEALEGAQDQVGWYDLWADSYGDDSMFSYAGPYLGSAAATGVQTQKIRVSPAIDATRMCELAYTAKWLPLNNAQSPMMLPEEGTHAMLNYAVAELHRANDDTLAKDYEAKADKHLASFLTWLRARQIQRVPTIKPYLM